MGKFKREIDGAKKSRNPKNKKNKTMIVFDEEKRNDWLTGFSKRKNERRKRAQHEEIERLKEEKRQLKKKKREERAQEMERMREAVGMEMPTEIESVSQAQVYNMSAHTVTVVDVMDANFTGHSGLRLGVNDEDDQEEGETKDNTEDIESTQTTTIPDAKNQKRVKKGKKSGKPHKNRSHLMDKRVKKKKAQVPNKWQRMRPKK